MIPVKSVEEGGERCAGGKICSLLHIFPPSHLHIFPPQYGSVMVGSVMVGSVMLSPRGTQGSYWWDGSCLGSYVGTRSPSTLPLQVAHVLTQGAEQEMDR